MPPTLSTTPTTRSESEGGVSPSPKRKSTEKPLETSLDFPVQDKVVDLESEIHKVESEKSTSSSYEESSSGEEEFHSTTRSVEELHSDAKTPVETIEESSEHDESRSSSSSEEEEDEETSSSASEQETVKEDQDSNGDKNEKESVSSKEEAKPVEHPVKVLEDNEKSVHTGTESETEVFETDNQATLPHTNNKIPITVLSESDFTDDNEEGSDDKKESSSSSESEKDHSRKNGDGSDHEDDNDDKKARSSSSSADSESTGASINNSSSAPSELDVQPMEVLKNVGSLSSANSNSNNNKSLSPLISRRPRLSDDTDSSNASRSPPKIHAGSNKLLARVDIAPTSSNQLQYSPRRSPNKMVTHPSKMAQSPRTQPGYGQPSKSGIPPGIPPYSSSHMPRSRHQPVKSHPPQYQGYPHHKPMTSASLNALYPPHPSAMQQAAVKRASSRGSLGSNSGSKLVHSARFDTAV